MTHIKKRNGSTGKNKTGILGLLKIAIDDAGPEKFEALVAHHSPAEYNRTWVLNFGKKSIRLCTRCSGAYLGILASIISLVIGGSTLNWLRSEPLLFLLPFPAVLDWSLHKFRIWRGNNTIRFISGALMGMAYAFYWVRFISNPFDFAILASALAYLLAVGFVLYLTGFEN